MQLQWIVYVLVFFSQQVFVLAPDVPETLNFEQLSNGTH